ncbi:hypothetical protein MPLSOD_10018 [Mesorhizobium sp. SOD10]|nr:hypothetical protein MPLSOD_10018 [Mesorhizobium sp. SOD10]
MMLFLLSRHLLDSVYRKCDRRNLRDHRLRVDALMPTCRYLSPDATGVTPSGQFSRDDGSTCEHPSGLHREAWYWNSRRCLALPRKPAAIALH